jgi:hypothetical protein
MLAAPGGPDPRSGTMGKMTAYWIRIALAALAAGAACASIAGCGLDVASPDLFVLHRMGQGHTLTLLVNDSGTIRCNGAKSKSISDPLLLDARDLAKDLDQDVKDDRRFPWPAKVFSYRVQLQDGTLTFSDAAAAHHPKYPELARAELFAAQAAQGPCGLTG